MLQLLLQEIKEIYQLELLRHCPNITYLNEKENEKKALTSLLPEDI